MMILKKYFLDSTLIMPGLLVIVTNLSDPVDQCQCLRKVKVLLQLRLVSYNQADSSVPAKHNYTFLAQNIAHSLSKFCFPRTLSSDTSLHHLHISKYFSFPSFHRTTHEALNRQWLFQSKFPKSFHNLPQKRMIRFANNTPWPDINFCLSWGFYRYPKTS